MVLVIVLCFSLQSIQLLTFSFVLSLSSNLHPPFEKHYRIQLPSLWPDFLAPPYFRLTVQPYPTLLQDLNIFLSTPRRQCLLQ